MELVSHGRIRLRGDAGLDRQFPSTQIVGLNLTEISMSDVGHLTRSEDLGSVILH